MVVVKSADRTIFVSFFSAISNSFLTSALGWPEARWPKDKVLLDAMAVGLRPVPSTVLLVALSRQALPVRKVLPAGFRIFVSATVLTGGGKFSDWTG